MSVPTIEDAIILAAQQHRGQKDKVGVPYICHPLSVMSRLRTDEERIVAVLHDVVEDCCVSLDDLRDLGYSETIVEALDYLTKRPEEHGDYGAFIRRIKGGPILAINVKLSDLADNMNPARRTEDGDETEARQAKYRRATQDLLTEALSRPCPSHVTAEYSVC